MLLLLLTMSSLYLHQTQTHLDHDDCHDETRNIPRRVIEIRRVVWVVEVETLTMVIVMMRVCVLFVLRYPPGTPPLLWVLQQRGRAPLYLVDPWYPPYSHHPLLLTSDLASASSQSSS
ncbi:uncharacterized protein C8R40DRAFT_1137558 [Lentinula edodes]|uniref:uncharacterized protein n=1 Tax=Lentinula edodes TaxID=5353 RepID=UPI001E8EB725|nr:uncharacterized protein C8R40DRAFT_1137558 [Lentinula edodes]KAH7867715.1 hypothetical protein C8R40DRAFT_1137558 [Lentinula edodes]